MVDFDRKLETVPRPRAVKISGRPCTVCRRDIQRALVIRIRLQGKTAGLSFDLNFCEKCLLDACVSIRTGRDHLCHVIVR